MRDDSSADFDATLARKSLISKGPSFSYFLSTRSSMDTFLIGRDSGERVSRHQDDEDHSPDRQQRVADGISDGVTKPGHVAPGLIAHQAERRGRGARPGDDAEGERIVELEEVLGDVHPKDDGEGGRERAPHEQAEALGL